MTEEEREDLIFICSLMSNYTEECLRGMPDEELERIYQKNTEAK